MTGEGGGVLPMFPGPGRLGGAGAGVVLLVLRVLFGGLFVAAGWSKLQNPLAFGLSIESFGIVPDGMVAAVAYIVPWLEIVAGTMVVLGAWTRESAAILGAMLLAFTAGVVKVLMGDKPVSCGCFGDLFGTLKMLMPFAAPLFERLQDDTVSMFTVWRNLVMFAVFALVAGVGGGRFAVDAMGPSGEAVEGAGSEDGAAAKA